MKIPKLLLASLFLLPSAAQLTAAQSLDPTFAPPSMYAPGTVISAVEQPDGKRVIAGLFNRVNGVPAWGVSRFDANGVLDATFQQNIGNKAVGYRLRLLNNGQFFLVNAGDATGPPMTVGGISRTAVLRLNADGTGDASFNAGTGPGRQGSSGGSFVDDVLPLPNGQAIAVGAFDQFNGAATNCIVRLTATGAVDPTFGSGGVGADPNDDIERIIALPNGQFLVSGAITSYNGVPCGSIIRLTADGSLDPTFVSPLEVGNVVDNLVVQPDGRILVAGLIAVAGQSIKTVARFMPNGAYDTSFTPPALSTSFSVASRFGDALQLQPDGKVILIDNENTGIARVARFNTDGTLDATFQVGTGPNLIPSSVTLLASGKILVEGSFTNFSGTLDRTLVQLTSTGVLDSSFLPVIQTTASVNAVARQADGKLVVGGSFSEINGQPVRRLARFNANGTLDATFPTNPGPDFSVVGMALQTDGRIVTSTQAAVQRFLATGSPDNTFTPPSFASSLITRLFMLSDDRIIVGGGFLRSNGAVVPQGFLQLMPDGTRDASFVPASTGAGRFTSLQAITQQSDGQLIIAGRFAPTAGAATILTVLRMQGTGAINSTFTGGGFTAAAGLAPTVNSMAIQADGKVVIGGVFEAYGGTARANVARLNADGSLDVSFTPPAITGAVKTLLLQPNNCVFLGGSFTSPGLTPNLARLLPGGLADASFAATAVPNNTVNSLLVQPDGNLVVGGAFASFSGQPSMGLARLTVATALSVGAPRAVADRTAAWPVPARTNLNVSFDPAAHPQSLDLLDALGRPVLHQSFNGTAATTLPVEKLASGTYLLRVTYSEGTVVRRVQLQ